MEKVELLDAWLRAYTTLRGNRFLDEASMNEMIILRILQHSQEVTATMLCNETKLLKSQMNHILDQMEKDALLQRERSTTDKRKFILQITEKGLQKYQKEHLKIARVVDRIFDHMSKDELIQLTLLMNKAISAVEENND